MSSKPGPTTKKFGKESRTIPHPSEKAQKWYPAEDEPKPKQVSLPSSGSPDEDGGPVTVADYAVELSSGRATSWIWRRRARVWRPAKGALGRQWRRCVMGAHLFRNLAESGRELGPGRLTCAICKCTGPQGHPTLGPAEIAGARQDPDPARGPVPGQACGAAEGS